MITELNSFPAQLKARAQAQREKADIVTDAFEKGLKQGLSIAYNAAGEELDFLLRRNELLFHDGAHDALVNGLRGPIPTHDECLKYFSK